MGREKVVEYYNERYKGSLSDEQCDVIDELLEYGYKIDENGEFKNVKLFYCPGGLDYEKMSAKSKAMMKIFVKMLNAKKNKTEADLEQIRMVSSSYDISDVKYIEPIIEYLNS